MWLYLIGSEGALADLAADGVMPQDFLLEDWQGIEEGLIFLAEEGIGLGSGLVLFLGGWFQHLQLLKRIHHFLQLLLTIENKSISYRV